MTIKISRNIDQEVGQEQIAALVTQAILRPANDDAPESIGNVQGAGWLRWLAGKTVVAPKTAN